MSVNLRRQLEHAIAECFTPRHSKYADKRNTEIDTSWKIYSLSSRRDLIATSRDFANFIKAEFSDVKKAYQITPEMAQEFIDSKALTCGRKTMMKIISHVKKLDIVCQHTYARSRIDWDTNSLKMPDVVKADGFKKDKPLSIDKACEIIETMKAKTNSESVNAVVLSTYLGLRVRETTHAKVENLHFSGGEFGFGFIEIPKGPDGGAKGGRARITPIISLEGQTALKQLVKDKNPSDYIVSKADGKPMTETNVETRLRECMDELYGKEFIGNRIHALRKCYAQSYFDVTRTGCSRKEAVSKTNVVLGHGADRGEHMVRMYVASIY